MSVLPFLFLVDSISIHKDQEAAAKGRVRVEFGLLVLATTAVNYRKTQRKQKKLLSALLHTK